jgi:hypothetical protein
MRADIVRIDLGNAPHVLAPGLEIVLGQAAAHRLARHALVRSQPDQLIRQQLQRPTGAACRRLRAGGRHEQGFLLAGEFALRAGARLFAQGTFQAAFDKTPLGPVNRRSAHADAYGDILIADPRLRRQQDLCPLEFACRVLASVQQRAKFVALGLAELDPIAYIHPYLLCIRGTDEQLNRMAGVSRTAKIFRYPANSVERLSWSATAR